MPSGKPPKLGDQAHRFPRVVLRHAEDGAVAANHFDQLAKLASTLKSLDATAPDPTEQRPGESDADYRARLEAMRGA